MCSAARSSLSHASIWPDASLRLTLRET
jgi:hypothetical protein